MAAAAACATEGSSSAATYEAYRAAQERAAKAQAEGTNSENEVEGARQKFFASVGTEKDLMKLNKLFLKTIKKINVTRASVSYSNLTTISTVVKDAELTKKILQNLDAWKKIVEIMNEEILVAHHFITLETTPDRKFAALFHEGFPRDEIPHLLRSSCSKPCKLVSCVLEKPSVGIQLSKFVTMLDQQ